MPVTQRILIVVVAAATTLLAAAPAEAAFPGANGKIAFENGNIYTVNPDGAGQTQVTDDITPDETPAWSPDGVKLAFFNFVRENCPGGDYEIFTVNADGTNRTRIDNNCAEDEFPAWSPEGTKIVFSRAACESGCTFETYTMNADGTNQTRVTSTPTSDFEPTWSPDATRIAFARRSCSQSFCSNDIYVMNADGTNQTRLTHDMADIGEPNWSPSGTKIAFTSYRDGNDEIYVMNVDGTNQTRLTNDMASDFDPAWSPDATKIAFTSNRDGNDEIYVMHADGTSPTRLTNSTASDREPDWQPIPQSYVRPRGATPLRVPLVPSYRQCTVPDNQHGAPLDYSSCSIPLGTSESPQLTVGTPDANGSIAQMSGSVLLKAVPGNPSTTADEADVTTDASVTDVRCVSANPAPFCTNDNVSAPKDYSGELQTRFGLRITDKSNTPNPGGPGPGTVQDFAFAFAVPCQATDSTTIGSTCALSTSFEALMPGSVKEGARSIWALDRIDVYDGGSDGDADTPDNTRFLTQGVFVP